MTQIPYCVSNVNKLPKSNPRTAAIHSFDVIPSELLDRVDVDEDEDDDAAAAADADSYCAMTVELLQHRQEQLRQVTCFPIVAVEEEEEEASNVPPVELILIPCVAEDEDEDEEA